MPETYQVPAIALIAALMLAFAYLHVRFRSMRTLLWLLAMCCAESQAILLWLVFEAAKPAVWLGSAGSPEAVAWMSALAEIALLLSSALFLASLSPQSFHVGRFRILFVVPYTLPVLIYTVLYYTVSQHPTGHLLLVYYGLGVWTAALAFLWSVQKGVIPIWLATLLVAFGVAVTFPSFFQGDLYWPLVVVQSGNMLMTALLVLYTVSRFSPGVLLASLGFAAWALQPLLQMHTPHTPSLLLWHWLGLTFWARLPWPWASCCWCLKIR